MIRRNLLVAAAFLVTIVLSACADATGPSNTTCPVLSGGGVCSE
ncbi:MAG: hypothetical protein WD802_10045 [Gemmatimonadaceae bacterium]